MNSVQPNVLDPSSLAGLKLQTREGSPEANKAVAQQFEAMFLQIVLKTMRESIPQGGMLESEGTKLFQGMHDQQLAQLMSRTGGIGLAQVVERQLNGTSIPRLPTYDLKGPAQAGATAASATSAAPQLGAPYSGAAQGFVTQVWPQAQQAAASLGVPPHFLVAQAALETGWGKSVIQRADGSTSYNLFNIKAGRDWQGEVVEARTTEYENGRAVERVERFRAYGSYAESFQDYTRLIGQNSRYAGVRGQSDGDAFARALQQGGYATDPAYADKLSRIINGNTLRQGLQASAR